VIVLIITITIKKILVNMCEFMLKLIKILYFNYYIYN